MQDQTAAEARREARRRRILQNSDDRLRKIKGDFVIADSQTNTHANASSTTIRTKVGTLDEDVNFIERCHSNDAFSPQCQPEFTEDEETVTTAQHFTETQQTKLTLLDKLCQCRVHIILLALIIRLTLFMDMGYIFGNKVLVPLLLVQLSLVLLPGGYSTVRSNNGGLLGAALILSGLTQSRAHGLIQAACIIKNLGIDLAFYFFTFFIAHALLQYIQI